MKKVVYILLSIVCSLNSIGINDKDSILKIEMHMSAFGVEADDVPSIDIEIDFVKNTGSYKKWYFNPAYKDSAYSIKPADIKSALLILQEINTETIQKSYTTNISDQASSKIIIYTSKGTYEISDHGLVAPQPLNRLYKLLYRF